MKRRWQRGLTFPLAASLVLAPACVRTDDKRDAAVELDTEAEPVLKLEQSGGLLVESLVYEPSRWPLEDFVANLSRGRFRESMRSFDPRYHATTSENEAIATLLEAGIIPVYVRARPTAEQTAAEFVAESDFELSDGSRSYELIPAAALPKEIARLNPKAVGANVLNVAVVVGATVIIIAAVCQGSGGGGIGNPFGGMGHRKDDAGEKEEPRVFNPVMQTVTIDYRDFLFGQGFVDAKGAREGLLFFKAAKRPQWTKLKLTRRASGP